MSPIILDGKELARQFRVDIKKRVDALVASGKCAPGLGVILVGSNPASIAYVGNKEKCANEVGFITKDAKLPDTATDEEIFSAIDKFNSDPEITGILLQLPLPNGKDAAPFIERIDPKKDADGLHPANQGKLFAGLPTTVPCTPLGCMHLIDLAYILKEDPTIIDYIPNLIKADLSGKSAVVIGRSVLVGKPVASLLLERNATVTITHSRTKDLEAVCREADILVAAVGRPEFVKGDWIKEGAIVTDVGINRVDCSTSKSGSKLVGDVNYKEALEKASAITPVPGGVGPMTVGILLANCLKS